MISAATNKSIDIARGRIAFGGYALENLKKLFASQNVALGMKNSLINATVQTIIALLVCSLAGYGFELYHDKAKDKLFSVLLLAMMIPQVATLIPLFKMMSKLGFINTVWGFMLPAISTPFLIMMFRQNSRNFPIDIMEAARIDGLSEIGIFFKMYMPVQKSTYAAAAVITFMNAWNSYLWPKVILNKPAAITMPMLIANLAAGYTVDYGVLMMGVLFLLHPYNARILCTPEAVCRGNYRILLNKSKIILLKIKKANNVYYLPSSYKRALCLKQTCIK